MMFNNISVPVWNPPRGNYIPAELTKHCLNGDAYVAIQDAYTICTGGKVPFSTFQCDLLCQQNYRKVVCEEDRLYTTNEWRYEAYVAEQLAGILRNNIIPGYAPPDKLTLRDEVALNTEQCNAVHMALSHRLSIILGGAGTGKTTLIQSIVDNRPEGEFVLAAPTGKAARNLTDRIKTHARTLHSVLGLHPDDDALSQITWEHTSLVVIDEASMMTNELLAGLLCKIPQYCRIVLVGDPNQLLSVGAGNVLPDLVTLGFPYTILQQNYRQAEKENALYHNVVSFSEISSETQLRYDPSFQLESLNDFTIESSLIKTAVHLYSTGKNVQILSPFNSNSNLSVRSLNRVLQKELNPYSPTKNELKIDGITFRDGDRVIINQNDYGRNCVNGDVGIFHVDKVDAKEPIYHVELADGRSPKWFGWSGFKLLGHAYALTVHKSQGSQFDYILFPVTRHFSGMLYRNLLYTAISRAQKQVILFGSRDALNTAIQTVPRSRKSMLIAKTRLALQQPAA